MALARKFNRRKYFLTKIDNVHVYIIMVHLDINKFHVNIIILLYHYCTTTQYLK